MSIQSCYVASTVHLNAVYDPSGLPSLTMVSSGILTIDGAQVFLNDVLLIKDQIDSSTNGVYFCSTEGDIGVNAVISRLPGFITPNEINTAGIIIVKAGDTQEATGWYVIDYIQNPGDFIFIEQIVYPLIKKGPVRWTNRVNGSATANVSTNSAYAQIPFLSGNMDEVVFNTLAINGAASGNFTGSTALFETAQGSLIGIQGSNGNNGNTITFQSPAVFSTIGVYMIEYALCFGNIRGIIDVSYKANGAGSFSPLRTAVDCYYDAADSLYVQFRDFVTITTAGSPLYIKWTANGKNASSSDYWLTLLAPFRVTLLG